VAREEIGETVKRPLEVEMMGRVRRSGGDMLARYLPDEIWRVRCRGWPCRWCCHRHGHSVFLLRGQSVRDRLCHATTKLSAWSFIAKQGSSMDKLEAMVHPAISDLPTSTSIPKGGVTQGRRRCECLSQHSQRGSVAPLQLITKDALMSPNSTRAIRRWYRRS
jgi:hypothetical protein